MVALNLFQTTVKNSQGNPAVIAGMSFGFGLLGSAIASAVTLNEEITYLLDLRYGTIMEFNKDNLRFLLTSFPELETKFNVLSPEAKDLYNTQIQFVKRMNELITKQ